MAAEFAKGNQLESEEESYDISREREVGRLHIHQRSRVAFVHQSLEFELDLLNCEAWSEVGVEEGDHSCVERANRVCNFKTQCLHDFVIGCMHINTIGVAHGKADWNQNRS